MKEVSFRQYRRDHYEVCMSLFDANCPAYFAPNERADYEAYLSSVPVGYEIAYLDNESCGAFGFQILDAVQARLQWILVAPSAQGMGVGLQMMTRVKNLADSRRTQEVHIAASQKSAPFFARFGAKPGVTTPHGWGHGMHRIDMLLSVQGGCVTGKGY